MADCTGGILQSHLLLPLWGDGRSQSGFAKNDRIQLEREVGSHGTYRFWIAEDLTVRGTRAELVVNAVSADHDRLVFSLNGTPLPGPYKMMRHGKGRTEAVGRKMRPCRSCMVPLASPPARFRDNILRAEVETLQANHDSPIVIEELEVTVVPRWEAGRAR